MRRMAIVTGGLALFAAACTIVNGLAVKETVVPQEEAGTPTGENEAGAVDPYPCAHLYPPPPPAPGPVDPSGTVFVTALSHVALGIHPNGVIDHIGFDLDQRCTCDLVDGGARTPPTCLPPNGDPAGTCDFDGGVDNASTYLFQLAYNLVGANIDLEADLNNDLKNGNHGILLWVDHYNGKADDDSVDIYVTISAGPESGDKPTFDAGEAWSFNPEDTTSATNGVGPRPKAVSKLTGQSYVRDHVLVGTGAIKLPLLANLTVTLGSGYVTGRIEQAGSTFYVANGTVTGRAPLDQVIRSIGGVAVPVNSTQHLCDSEQNKDAFSLLKAGVCDAVDIMADPTKDRMGLKCDGLSLGVTFDAVPATIGTERALTSVTFCEDADVSCPK